MVRASREGNWELHLAAIEQMIPWCFAHDNINYARYLPAYLSEMTHLEETHPEAYEFLRSGGFSVQVGEQKGFQLIKLVKRLSTRIRKQQGAQKASASNQEL